MLQPPEMGILSSLGIGFFLGATLIPGGRTADAAEPSPKEIPASQAELDLPRQERGAGASSQEWWSLRPLVRPPVPRPEIYSDAAKNPIDSFILARLETEGLRPSPPAGRRTLIRRLTFDLIGLPPAPEEVEAFVSDPDPRAYEALVDRLLTSPRYGERWARHWLDVVHFGETHGYDKDKPRPNAWPYRDYVIRAFNQDKPYSRFVREQMAGDILYPFTRDGIEALGFLAAGPWDLIGHEEVPETKIDGQVARHLDRDDMVANTIQTFASLTVQCAQCHDHKFDPISSEDYYSLQAVFAALDRTDKKYDLDPAVARRRAELEQRRQGLASDHEELEERLRVRGGEPLAGLDHTLASLSKVPASGDAFGYHSQIESEQEITKWVQVDLGRRVPIDQIVLLPCNDDFNNIGAGFGFPLRFRVELADNAAFEPGGIVVEDRTGEDAPPPGLTPQRIDVNGQAGRYVRVTATKLAPRQNDYIFALAELEVHLADGSNAALGTPVTALDSVENPPRWRIGNLTDGWYPGKTGTKDDNLAGLRQRRRDLLLAAARPDERAMLDRLGRESKTVHSELEQLPPPRVAYVGAVHHGSGNFTGTGATGGRPRPIRVLARGDVQKPGREVAPGALSCVTSLPSQFELPASHSEADRRAALAHWLTDRDNPLVWRSIVNRIWQHHFGRGLVETPNDFGRMGGLPTHPELLDWLAVEFRDGGQSLKRLHKLIVTSATYRQVSGTIAPEADQERFPDAVGPRSPETHQQDRHPSHRLALELDADNRLLWRQNRRKLEAEAVRDAVLFVSGSLDLTMGGPSFQDFVIEKPEHSPHYEYHLHDPEDPKSHRRSVYRFVVRSQQQPFMTALDCADPSMQVARRSESTSPPQALALLNDALMVTLAKHFAAKLERMEGGMAARIRRAHAEALGRLPTPEEERELTAFAREHGLANLCRVLFNLNEFAFVD